MMENSKERRPFIQRWQSGSVIRNWGTDLIFLSSLFGISPFSLFLLYSLQDTTERRKSLIPISRGRTRTRTDVGEIFFPLRFHLPRRKRSSSATPSLSRADPKNAMDLSGAKSGSADDDNNSEESGLQIRHLQPESPR